MKRPVPFRRSTLVGALALTGVLFFSAKTLAQVREHGTPGQFDFIRPVTVVVAFLLRGGRKP